MPDAAPLEPGDPRSLGRYEVIGRIGAGGQGAVYLGRSPEAEFVAIKVLHAQYAADPSARARFIREVAAAQKVEAFCTARVLEADVHGDQPYIVSEFIDGPSLHDVVVLHGPRSPHELERLAIGTVTALAAIHEAGIVHRDFKPNNVMLAADGPRVVDFGIARTVNSQESAVTATGMVVGTPGYLAPEQLTGAALQPTVDIFAWGATMVFAATGRSPFEADTLPVIINRILNEEPDLSALHGPLRDLIAQCLAKDPASRPPAHQLLLRLLGNAGAAPGPAPERGALLAQGTQLAAQLPAPPPVRPRSAPAAHPAPAQTPPPMPLRNPSTPPPMPMPQQGPYQPHGPVTPPPLPIGSHGPTTPPPVPMAMHQQVPMAMHQPGPRTPQPMPMAQGPMMAPPRPTGPLQRRSNNTPIIVGIGCGALVLVFLIVVVVALIANSGQQPPVYTPAPTYSQSTVPYSPYSVRPTPSFSFAGSFPMGYQGTWTGNVYDSSRRYVGAKVSLYPLLGTGLVTYTLKSSSCFGMLKLEQNGSDKIVMRETVSFNSAKCTSGYETLYLYGNTIRYEFRRDLSQSTAEYTGTLTKN